MRDDSGLNRSTIRYLMIYAVLVGLAIIVNLPGRAIGDSLDSLYQARRLDLLNSWHAPFVTFCYGLLSPLTGSPTGALVIQSFLLMLWPAAIAARIIEAKLHETLRAVVFAAWSLVCMICIALVGFIAKDFLLLGFMSAGLAAFTGHQSPRAKNNWSGLRVLWIVFCILACCLVRPTNILVLGCAALLANFAARPSKRITQRIANTGFMTVGIWIATTLVNSWFLPSIQFKPEKATIIFDIAGMSYYTGENLLENASANLKPTHKIDDCYSSKQVDNWIWGACQSDFYLLWEHLTPAFWARMIAQHPYAYARHRIAFIQHLLSMDKSITKMVAPPPPFKLATNTAEHINEMEPEKRIAVQLWEPTIAYAPFGRIAHNTFRGPLGHPLTWIALLALASISLFKLAPGDDKTLMAVMIAVGLGNVVMLAIFSPGDNLRYLLPTAFCALVVTVKFVELAARRWIPRREPLA